MPVDLDITNFPYEEVTHFFNQFVYISYDMHISTP